MVKKKVALPEYTETIRDAVATLQNGDIPASLVYIREAILLDMDAPEAHNLLGIFYELVGNDLVACKHYRAAYALDPTYKPACRNLERLVRFEWGPVSRQFDYGIKPETGVETKKTQRTASDISCKELRAD